MLWLEHTSLIGSATTISKALAGRSKAANVNLDMDCIGHGQRLQAVISAVGNEMHVLCVGKLMLSLFLDHKYLTIKPQVHPSQGLNEHFYVKNEGKNCPVCFNLQSK